MGWEAALSLACDSSAVAEGRGFCADQLSQVLGESAAARDCIDDAVLVTSELLTNALRADCAGIVVALDVSDAVVRISVIDDADGHPEVQHPMPKQTHGRGLQIVARLSIAWGVTPTSTGKQVWADLALPVQQLR
jgi:anti-sigma regulatory factor (Ser/Thr protein kinase)